MLNEGVRVHYNLRKKNYTISRYIKGVGWRKAAESERVNLCDVEFKVSEAGRQRAVRQGKRNVHAFAYGTLLQKDFNYPQVLFMSKQVCYNPFKNRSFVDEDGMQVSGAAQVMFDDQYGVQAWGVIH